MNMERTIRDKILNQIFLDKDVARRVDEWISKREEIYQASGAAAQCNIIVTEYIGSLSIDELKIMVQELDLNIERPLTKAWGFRSSSPNISGGVASDHDVPSEVNEDDNDVDDDDDEHAKQEEELNAAPPKKPSSLTLLNCKEVREEIKDDIKKLLDHHVGSTMDMKVRSDQPIANSLNQSGSKSVRSQAGSYQHPLEQNADRIRGSMSGSAQIEVVEGSGNATEHTIEATGDLPHGLSNTTLIQHRQYSGNIPGQVTTPPGIGHEAEGQNLSHVGRLQSQNLQPPGSQPSNSPANSATAHSSTTSTGPPQNPDLQANIIIVMLERELERRNQPTRCTSCTSFQAEIKSLKKSNRYLGQQLERIRFQSFHMDKLIKDLKERIKEQNHNHEEILRVINYFLEIMGERKKQNRKLTEENEMLRGENEQETDKELHEVFVLHAKEEEERLTELLQKMQKQTEMIENVVERVGAECNEKQVVNEELRQRGNDLEKENQLLRARVEDLTLQNQTLEAEKKKETLEKQAVQEEYACREAQLNERIIQETDHLLQVYKDLCIYAEEHGLRRHGSTGLNSERE